MAEAATSIGRAQAPEPTPPGSGRILWLPIILALLGIGLATTGARWGYRAAKEQAARELQGQLTGLRQQQAEAGTSPAGGDRVQFERDLQVKEQELARALADRDRFKYFSRGDAERYEEIVNDGYRYQPPADPQGVTQKRWLQLPQTNLVWYPLYPLLGLVVRKLTGLPAAVSLNIVTNLSLLVAIPLFFLMARRHFANHWPVPDNEAAVPAPGRWAPADAAALWSTLLLLVGPAAIFLYANFTESLFVLLLAAFLYCLQGRRWWWAAVLAALASSSRAQGALFGPVLALSYLVRSDQRSVPRRLGVAVVLGLISATGLMGYLAYQQVVFGEPLAFLRAQEVWGVGISKATLLHAANPVNAITNFLALTFNRPDGWSVHWPMAWEAGCVIWPPIVLAVWGRRYLSWELQVLGWLLWGLPYVSSSLSGYPPQSMPWMSMGRFMAVALPLHLALGPVMVRRRWLGPVLVSLSAAAFAVFAYKAGAGWWIG
ncbi:hypothetical protein HQ590_13890 [bacterium]|nr:hypothetical protein [bacterium]